MKELMVCSKSRGSRIFKKGSFAKAHTVYLKAQKLNLSPPDQTLGRFPGGRHAVAFPGRNKQSRSLQNGTGPEEAPENDPRPGPHRTAGPHLGGDSGIAGRFVVVSTQFPQLEYGVGLLPESARLVGRSGGYQSGPHSLPQAHLERRHPSQP